MDRIEYQVPPSHPRMRADKVLLECRPDLSRSRIQRLFEAGLVWLEDEAIIKSRKLSSGDRLTFTIPPPGRIELAPRDIPLDILFEDSSMIVVNKPSGMVVHPGAGTGDDTLVHALLHHCRDSLCTLGGVERPGIVHRLDKETSGVMVAAKTDEAFLHLSNLFAARRVGKVYLALARGLPARKSGTIQAPIARHRKNRLKMAIQPNGRQAWTDWEIREAFGSEAVLLRVIIHTGRTHQIRVHLSHLGHPVLGDRLYGSGGNPACDRVCLHSHELSFTHPTERREMQFIAEIPEEMQRVLVELRGKVPEESP